MESEEEEEEEEGREEGVEEEGKEGMEKVKKRGCIVMELRDETLAAETALGVLVPLAEVRKSLLPSLPSSLPPSLPFSLPTSALTNTHSGFSSISLPSFHSFLKVILDQRQGLAERIGQGRKGQAAKAGGGGEGGR